MTAVTEARAKYTADELKAMLAKGHAIKNASGDPSYPIADAEDLHDAIRAVGRGGSDHDAIRRHIISRAKALGMSSAIPDNWGADGSLGGSSSADRAAFELRKRRRGSMFGRPERRGLLFDTGAVELRARPSGHGTVNYEFNGYAVVYNAPFDMWDQWGDPYQENVETRACAPSVGRPDLDTPFLIGHDDGGIALARTRSGTMRLSDDSHGLHVNVPELDGRSPLVQSLASAVERGDMDEMSVGFVCRQQQWSDDYMIRNISEMDIHRGDVSIVVTAANPATAGVSLTAPVLEAAAARRRTEARAASHPPFTGTHSHAHPAYGGGGQHEHEHEHHGDANHDHHQATTDDPDSDGLTPTLDQASAGRPLEQLARGEVADNDSHPDFNVPGGGMHGPFTGRHDHGHAAYGAPDGEDHGHPHSHDGDADHGHNHQYSDDGTLVLEDSGVVEEVGGAMGEANLLKLRLRLLELA